MINKNAIAEIAQKTPTAEAFFTYAACRERNVRDGVSRLSALRAQMIGEGFDPVPQELLSMFRELDRAGIGSLKGDFFRWGVPIKKVAEVVFEKPARVEPIQKDPLSELPKALKSLVIYYADGKEMSISFTPNLTREEVRFALEKVLREC